MTVTLGIVGAGQLARMTAQAAISLAVETVVLATDLSEPACAAASSALIGDPADMTAMERLGARCEVLTFDHERVDPAVIEVLQRRGHVVRPSSEVLRFADKAYQRRCLAEAGIPVPPFCIARSVADIEAFGAVHGWPLVVKSATGGYDGRGVHVVADATAASGVVRVVEGAEAVVEPLLQIDRELAVVVARRPSGETVAYPVTETVQIDGICIETVAPAEIDEHLARQATSLALRLAELAGACGVLAVELFATDQGLVVNELAPRPHNSGHWTIEGAATSQFENHVRGVLDWPLGDTSLTAPAVATVNVLGGPSHDPADGLPGALGVSGANVHLYAKRRRPGRKLGHVTVRADAGADALQRAHLAAGHLGARRIPSPIEGAVQS